MSKWWGLWGSEVPKVHLQLTKSIFCSMGVKFYDCLPTEHCQIDGTREFRDLLTKYF